MLELAATLSAAR